LEVDYADKRWRMAEARNYLRGLDPRCAWGWRKVARDMPGDQRQGAWHMLGHPRGYSRGSLRHLPLCRFGSATHTSLQLPRDCCALITSPCSKLPLHKSESGSWRVFAGGYILPSSSLLSFYPSYLLSSFHSSFLPPPSFPASFVSCFLLAFFPSTFLLVSFSSSLELLRSSSFMLFNFYTIRVTPHEQYWKFANMLGLVSRLSYKLNCHVGNNPECHTKGKAQKSGSFGSCETLPQKEKPNFPNFQGTLPGSSRFVEKCQESQ
jgi:hypothetical protein